MALIGGGLAVPELVLQRTSGLRALDLKEFWRYRELLYFLVLRDLKARFAQTALGVLWVVLRPLVTILVFTMVFGRLARIPSDGIPYAVFVMAAMAPWNYISSALGTGVGSLVGSSHLITKVYFPRLVLPVASLLGNVVDASISFLLVLVLMAWYGRVPSVSALLTVPLLSGLTFLLTLGLTLLLGATNVRYRDVGNVIPFALQIWMYASPVVYPVSLVPERYRWLAALNPLSGLFEGFRSALLDRPWPVSSLAYSALVTAIILIAGLYHFRSTERTFADTV